MNHFSFFVNLLSVGWDASSVGLEASKAADCPLDMGGRNKNRVPSDGSGKVVTQHSPRGLRNLKPESY